MNCHTASGIPTKTVNATQTYAAPGGFKVASYVSNLHSYVSTTTCISCHSSGTTYTGMSPITTIAAAVGQIVINPATVTGCTTGSGVAHVSLSECATCHAAANAVIPSTGNTGFCSATTMPANHIPNPGALPCTSCHTNSSNPYGVGLAVMNHTGTTGVCVQCHVANSYINNAPANPMYTMTAMGTHIPTSASCDACHTAPGAALAPLTGFKLATPLNLLQIHTAVGGTAAVCSTCHSAGASYYGVTMVTQPSNHIPNPGGLACSICHTNATSSSYAVGSWKFTSANQMVHTGIVSGCNACHDPNAYYFGTLTIKLRPPATLTSSVCSPANAVGTPHQTTGDCAGCHSSTTIPSSGQVGFCKAASMPANHVPVSAGVVCTACHASGTGVGSGVFTHTGNTYICTTCHGTTSGIAFYGVTPVYASQPGTHVPLPGGTVGSWGTACNVCHNTVGISGVAASGAFLTGASNSSSTGLLHARGPATAGQCNACHRQTVVYAPVGTEKITVESSGHQSGGSCDKGGCHSISTFSK